jgi:hypothetical protein
MGKDASAKPAKEGRRDMIRETELIAQFTVLERRVLTTWIEEGVIVPERDDEGYLFVRPTNPA